MSSISVNTITDASGGATTSINGFTPSVSNMGGKNRIINGDMRIDQRNNGATQSIGLSDLTVIDRWRYDNSAGTAVYNLSQSTDAPDGVSTSMKFECTTAQASPSASHRQRILYHGVEGLDFSDLGQGTSAAKDITLSFWVKSSQTGVLGFFFQQTVTSVASYYLQRTITINSPNTWERKTIVIPARTTGSQIVADNNLGFRFELYLLAGSDYSSGTSVSDWSTSVSGAALANGQTFNAGASVGATFYITGFQLEAGSVATPFCPAGGGSYGAELALCQRYYWRIKQFEVVATAAVYSSAAVYVVVNHPVTMRTDSSFSYSNLADIGLYSSALARTVTSATAGGYTSPDKSEILLATSGLSGGWSAWVRCQNNAGAYMDFSAEL